MSEERQPLPYDRAAAQSIPRWQFRLLFLIVVLHLAITIQSSYAPGIAASVKRRWAEYQESRRIDALQQQAWKWSEPAEKVVWDDDPATAAGLLAGPGYFPVGVPSFIAGNYPFLAGWPPGAAARPPQFANQLFQPDFPFSKDGLVQSDENYAVVFMHGLKSPAGERRLVYVYLKGSTDLNMARIPEPPGRHARGRIAPFEASANRKLRLIAVPCLPADGPTPPKTLSKESTGITVAPQSTGQWKVAWKWVPAPNGEGGQVLVEPRDDFRFYAGQVNPTDPGHFTIAYEHDGVRGTIHGRLKDDGSIDLRPDAGMMTGEQWVPRAK